MKLIVHPGTGTVIDADECLLLDTEKHLTEEEIKILDGNDFFEDHIICEIAEERGVKIFDNDLSWGNVIAFSPKSLREEAGEILDQGYFDFDKNDTRYLAMKWALETATISDLQDVASYILDDDAAWAEYRTQVIEGLVSMYIIKKGEGSAL